MPELRVYLCIYEEKLLREMENFQICWDKGQVESVSAYPLIRSLKIRRHHRDLSPRLIGLVSDALTTTPTWPALLHVLFSKLPMRNDSQNEIFGNQS